MRLQDRSISRAVIIDDDPSARESYQYVIEELELTPWAIEGPLSDIPEFINDLGNSDVVLCDYHLKRHSGYADCDGDELVAKCYKAKIPGVLCTTFPDAIMRRDFLRHIPGLIMNGNPAPDELRTAWDRCLREQQGDFEPWRRPWRTLVRVAEVEEEHASAYVIVPAWDVRRKIRVDIGSLSEEIVDRIQPNRRFHALVNIGAESHEQLYFDEWEVE